MAGAGHGSLLSKPSSAGTNAGRAERRPSQDLAAPYPPLTGLGAPGACGVQTMTARRCTDNSALRIIASPRWSELQNRSDMSAAGRQRRVTAY
jgi:hypothetical protein